MKFEFAGDKDLYLSVSGNPYYPTDRDYGE